LALSFFLRVICRLGLFEMATLVRTQGNHEGKWVYTVGPRCVLGRHAECDISEIFAGNGGVSRFHAQIECTGGRYFVEDKGSRNGTSVNGQRVTGRMPLRDGDRLVIAGVELIFFDDAEAGAEVADPASSSSGITFDEPAEPARPHTSLTVAAPGAGTSLPSVPADKLRALVQMLKVLGRSLDIDATLHELLEGLFAIFPQAQCGFVAFTSEGEIDITPRATNFRNAKMNSQMRVSRSLVRHVLSRREAVLWGDRDSKQGDSNFRTLAELSVHSLMSAPLLDGDGNPFGIVQIDNNNGQSEFTQEDLEVMVAAVSQAAIAVRFAKLHEDAMRRQAVERDLVLARNVQLGLLPEGFPSCEGYEFFAYYRAAYDVGGDYYDFIELPNGRLALVVADAAGKGVSAALMVAKLSGELKYYLSCEAPGEALSRMNESLCAGTTGRFVTMLTAIIDRRSSTLTLVNAGHPAPLCRRTDGNVEVVGESARDPALGIMPGRKYQETRLAIKPGDVWLMYTDGFSEATSARDEMFGAARLRERLASAPAVVHEAGDRIVRQVQSFMGDQPQSDDMCLVGWGRLNAPAECTTEFRIEERLAAEQLD
jgi:serine phosphatase RsbU (regulator of sigma subunit)